ncbi:unnamed protein product [Callosobruchus maculatus]|uniref:Uncharacterized protein n=1 Tax=Callosobruchus maculatus TaxID=64391 RepID=A0A653C9W8_CALMS|nr:unnamed protein product [Callosobruchus maculatus]
MRKYSLSSFFIFTKYFYTTFILKLWKKIYRTAATHYYNKLPV